MRPRSSIRAFPAPRPVNFGRPGWCKWCGLSIPDVIDGKRSTQRLWHPECVWEYNLHTRAADQKDFLIGRDGKKCAQCGESPERWLRGMELHVTRQHCFGWRSPKEDVDWRLVYWDEAPGSFRTWTEEERKIGWHFEISRVCALEVDHRVPLWSVNDLADEDRRWYFGPGNLWLLCPKCHKAKTASEAGQRAQLRRDGPDQPQLL